jgi:hypothetical protein
VSYDIYFAKRRPGRGWAEVLEELEEAAEQDGADDLPLTPELIAAWDRIVPQAQELLGETGLGAYDPQTDLAIADSTPAVSTMSAIATELQDVPGGYTGRANDGTPDAGPR